MKRSKNENKILENTKKLPKNINNKRKIAETRKKAFSCDKGNAKLFLKNQYKLVIYLKCLHDIVFMNIVIILLDKNDII